MTTRSATSARGDERRAALLEALEAHLQGSSLESINIADLSRRAGVTRSAFYFYFEDKAAAVAALMEDFYDQAAAAGSLLAGDGGPAAVVEALVRALVDALDGHTHLYRATLEARRTSAAVRELWDADRASFVPAVAAMIDRARAGGEAPDGPPAHLLASVLLDVNDRMLERLATEPDVDRDQLVQTVVTVWLRTIYATTDATSDPGTPR